MLKKTLYINGVPTIVIANPEDSLADVLRGAVGADRHEGRLRPGTMRSVFGHPQRETRAFLRDQHAARSGRGFRDHC